MSKLFKSKVFNNASWIIGCKIGQMIINLFVGMLTARYLGPSNYGIISYAASIVAFVVPLTQLGLSNILVQEIINHPEKEGDILGTSIALSVISSVLCIIGIFSFVNIVNVGEHETIIVCMLYSTVLFFQAFELINYWFQAKLLSKYTALMSFVAYVFVAIYKVYLLVTKKDVYWFAAAQAIDYALIAFGSIAIYKKLKGQRFSLSTYTAKRMLSRSHFYIMANMLVAVFSQTDRIMIKLMLNNEATGYYSAAITCATLTTFVFNAIIDSIRPTIFECRKESVTKFEDRVTFLYSLIFYLSLLQCLFMTLFARFLIRFLYGDNYLPAVSALQIGVWYTTFSYLGSVRNIWILAENQQKYLWLINLIGAGTNVVLNFLFIPILGINGAALTSLITQFFTNVIIGYFITPIRHNNELMIKGLNPRILLNLINS